MKCYRDYRGMGGFEITEEMEEHFDSEERFQLDLIGGDSTDVLISVQKRETVRDEYKELFSFKLFEFLLDAVDGEMPLDENGYLQFKTLAEKMKSYADVILVSIAPFKDEGEPE